MDLTGLPKPTSPLEGVDENIASRALIEYRQRRVRKEAKDHPEGFKKAMAALFPDTDGISVTYLIEMYHPILQLKIEWELEGEPSHRHRRHWLYRKDTYQRALTHEGTK